jgi:uncharacterized membrane protein
MDRELKKRLLQQNGLEEEASADKIQEYLVEQWEKEEKSLAWLKRVVKGFWLFTFLYFIGYVFYILAYEWIEDLVERSPFEYLIQLMGVLLLFLFPVLVGFTLFYSIMYLVKTYNHKRQFERMVDQNTLHKHLAKMEALMEQLIAKKNENMD